MTLYKIPSIFLLLLLAGGQYTARCQELPVTKTFTPQDTTRTVEILPGVRKSEYRKIDSVTELQILAGNVRLKQGNSYFECDSCVINKRLNLFEAFGNVHINNADTADVYAGYLRYFTDKKIAYLTNNVRLTDGEGTLSTNDLEYDLNTKVGIYRNGGRVVNKKSVLTSQEGFYYADLKDVYFKKKVELKDPAYYLSSDSLLYNTGTETVRFITETFIRDSSGRTIRTRAGYYNLKTGQAEFGERPIVDDGPRQITGDKIVFDDSTGISQVTGNAILVDTAEGLTVIANLIFSDRKKDAFLATNKPLMIIKQDDDSVFVAADTLFSARLTDLYGIQDSTQVDTLKGVVVVDTEKKDSTNRYFEAFRNVRIFSDSLQAVCDSMFYSFKDSIFRLYDDPVVWSNKNQVTGDTILLHTKNKKADKMQVYENSLLVNQLEPEVYNQIKSTRMDAYFINGDIDSVRAGGNAECIYYIQDDDSAFTGINQSTSDLIDIYFKERDLQRVVFRSAVKGIIWPAQQKTPQEMRLNEFKWHEERRPKTRFELFE